MCHSKDEKLDKEVAFLDKKKKRCGIRQNFGTVRKINCKSPLQKAWPDNCWMSVLVLVLMVSTTQFQEVFDRLTLEAYSTPLDKIMFGENTAENFHIKSCLRQFDSKENH